MSKKKIESANKNAPSVPNLVDELKKEKIEEVAAYLSKSGDSIDDALRKAALDKHEFFAFVSENKELKKIIDKAITDKVDYLLEYTLPDMVIEKIKNMLSTDKKIETKTRYVPNEDGNLQVDFVEEQEKERDISPVLLLQLAQQLVPRLNPSEINTADISRKLQTAILRVPEVEPIKDSVVDVEFVDVPPENKDSESNPETLNPE